MVKKLKPIVNLALALEAVTELVADICQCGHLNSEHFLDKRLKAVNCSVCPCPKFGVAFIVTTEPTKKAKKKR